MRRAEAREATEAGAWLESLRAGGQWRADFSTQPVARTLDDVRGKE